ncbi:uncharacterized protein [Ambystoma mexicanum]|uniref:uncharacterized protein n=1 Tax=Ambystoma mexicanum TaxID=8296 RepID=UPI0037E993FE
MNVEDPTIHGVKAEEVPGAYSKDAPVGTTAFIMEDSSKCMTEDGASAFLGDAEICKEEGCGQREVEAGSLKQQQVVEGSRSLASMIEGAGHARPATIVAGAGGARELAVEVVGLRPCDEAETGLTSSVIDGTLPSDSLRVKASLGDCSQDTVCPDTSLDEEASKNEHDGPRDSATACPVPEKDVLMDFATSCPVTSLAEEASNPKKEGPRHSAFEPAHHSACLMEGTSPGGDHQIEKSADPSLFGNTQVRASLTVEAVRRLVAKHHFRKSGTVQPVTGQLTAQVPTPGFSAPKVNVSEEENDPSGRCCICNDERSWHNNLLVYCDGGPACKVAVHQGCYGIVKVPEGPWFCRKCESQERAAKVKCELCPQKVGALKRTDTGGWAHVVCALYIPEVDFACTATMEPILLKYVPRDRFTKVCYLCHIEGRESKGACMTCNAPKCAKAFHATCAQSAGLLCAERGTGSETLKYCGYCKEHLVQLGLFSKNGKKVPSHRKKEYYEKKVLDAKQRGKEQNKKSISNNMLIKAAELDKDLMEDILGVKKAATQFIPILMSIQRRIKPSL